MVGHWKYTPSNYCRIQFHSPDMKWTYTVANASDKTCLPHTVATVLLCPNCPVHNAESPLRLLVYQSQKTRFRYTDSLIYVSPVVCANASTFLSVFARAPMHNINHRSLHRQWSVCSSYLRIIDTSEGDT